jgi:hypothetical protein
MKLRPAIDAIRRGLIAGLIGSAVCANQVGATPSALLRFAHNPSTTLATHGIAPSSLWNGVWGSGFDPTGVSAEAEPTPTTARLTTGNPRPSIRPMFADKMTVDRDASLGFLAGFLGQAGGAQGLQRVRIHLEGVVQDIFVKSDKAFTDLNGQAWVNHLHHVTLDFVRTMLRATAAGAATTCSVKFYAEAIANETGADSQIVGPFTINPRVGLLSAPWGGPAIYDKVVLVDNAMPTASGNTYTTWIEGLQALITAGAKCGLVSLIKTGAHPQWTKASSPTTGTAQVTSGVALATQLTTIAADPRTATGAWIGDGTATAGIGPRQDGILWLNMGMDVTMFGVGFNGITTGFTSNDQTMWWQNCRFFQGSGAVGDTNWNGVAGAGALYKGAISGTYFLNAHVVNFGWLECDASEMTYGFSGSPTAGIARNCTGHKSFKFHQNMLGSYNCTISETGTYNSPHATPIPSWSLYYTGASATGYIEKTGNTGAAGIIGLFESNHSFVASIAAGAANSTVTLTVASNTSGGTLNGKYISAPSYPPGAQIVAEISVDPATGIGTYTVQLTPTAGSAVTSGTTWLFETAHMALTATSTVDDAQTFFTSTTPAAAGFHSTQLATTAAQKRAACFIWIGTRPTTPASAGVPARTALSGSSGSPTVFSTLIDVHCDAASWFGSSNSTTSTTQNIIVVGLKVYGKKAGQVLFLNNGGIDCFFDGCESNDNSTDLGAEYTGFTTGWGIPESNVVLINASIIGVGESISLSGTPDKWCGIIDSFLDNGAVLGSFGISLATMRLEGLMTRTATIPASADADSRKLDSATYPSLAAILTDPVGTAPYGIGGGSAPNFTPANSSVLTELGGRIAGSRNLDGTLKLAA